MSPAAFINFTTPVVIDSHTHRISHGQCRASSWRHQLAPFTTFQQQRRALFPKHRHDCGHGFRPWSMSTDDAQPPANNPSSPNRELSPAVRELRSVLKKCPLYLVGPMGSGKSAVGRYLARELSFTFLDTDILIEELLKKPVSQIFAEEGEQTFRDIETQVLAQTSSFIGCCVATGGGVVLRKENWGHLQTGIVIYLDTPVDVLYHRLKHEAETENRPLLKGSSDDPEELRNKIESLLNDRQHLYTQADISVNCAHHEGVDDTAKEIVRVLTNFIKENPPKLSALYLAQNK